MIDLHMHSTHSDGELSPAQLVEEAASLGVSVLSITDHDAVSAYFTAKETAEALGLRLISGIECNTDGEQGELHILGYAFDPAHQRMADYVSWRQGERMKWSKAIVQVLQKLGYRIDWENCRERAGNDVIVRTHIADELVARGYFNESGQAYQALLTKGAPAFIEREGLTAAEAIALIHEAGGKAFLAHPGIYRWEWSLAALVEQGLDGIEVYYSQHDEAATVYWNDMADHYRLFKSCGSDFHGYSSRSPFPPGSVACQKEELMTWLEKVKTKEGVR
ncbi:PHP domain-containing protein [Halalkalibacter oceani]|uniref:PHP domain-containing protein n=1 Tax=Halalkalibacter oceani TaxID=1653776 RepID=A0A9X2INQ2_9BACI|nr:PHP domain-containing protein [Halalkalibacter oceani]MCM3714021.1 PHP domain-containing protein [Halalkalibacter oceani]